MAQQYVANGWVAPEYYQSGITINWNTKVIFVPKFYLTYISGTTYQLDTNQFRLDLKDIEDNTDGMVYPDTHRHNTEVVLSGVTYARVIEIINGYTITFEDGLYAVNLVGSNNNIPDVLNLNSVSVRASNSAGLQLVNTSGGVGTVTEVANAVWNAAQSSYSIAGTMGKAMGNAGLSGDPWATDLSTYNTANTAGKYVKDTLTNTSNIAVGSSSINAPASAFQLIYGVVTAGTFADTRTVDVGQHVIYDNAGAFDINYTFNVGLSSVPSSVTISCAVNDQHETIDVYAWHVTNSSWEKIGFILGQQSSTSFPTSQFILYTDHKDSSGLVKIRFTQTAISDIHLHIDQLFVSHAVITNNTDIAEAVRTELTPELTHILQVPTTSSGLTTTQATMLLEMYQLLGLDPTKPLIVTDTSRSAGAIDQSIATSPTETIVTRV